MNSPTDTQNQSPTSPSAQRPLGYWLRTIDVSIRSAMRDAFAEQGIGRRSWRTLSVIADGANTIDEIEAVMPPRRGPRGRTDREGRGGRGRFGRRGFGGRPGHRFGEHPEHPERGERPDRSEHPRRGEHPFASRDGHAEGAERSFGPRSHYPEHPFGARGEHPLAERGGRPGRDGRGGRTERPERHEHDHRGHCGPEGRRRRSTQDVVDAFVDRGWVTVEDGIALTDAGREAHATLLAKVTAIRSTVTDAVSPEDFATTVASLESIARGFGWDESTATGRAPRDAR